MCLPTYLLLIDLRNELSLYSITQLYRVVFLFQPSKHSFQSAWKIQQMTLWLIENENLGFRNNASTIYHGNIYFIRDNIIINSVIFRNKTCYYRARIVKVKIVKYWFFFFFIQKAYKQFFKIFFFFLVIPNDA